MNHPFNQDLQSVLDTEEASDFLPSGSWMEGGCALLGEALVTLIPDADLKVIGRPTEHGVYDHVVVVLKEDGETLCIDYDGIQTLDELIEKVRNEWFVQDVEFANFDKALLDDFGVRWLAHSVDGFRSFLSRELGPIDPERLSMAWAEELPVPGF